MGSSVRYPWHFEFQSYQNHMGSEIFPGKLPAVHSATHGILNFSPIKITWAANFFRESCTPTLSLILTCLTYEKPSCLLIMLKCHPCPRAPGQKCHALGPLPAWSLPRASGLRPSALGRLQAGRVPRVWHFFQDPSGRGDILSQNAMSSEIFPGVSCTTHGILDLITWLAHTIPIAF